MNPLPSYAPFSTAPRALRLGGWALAYFAAQLLAFHFPDSVGLISAIWPASGIALAALLLSPRKDWPALVGCLAAASLAVNLTTGRPLVAIVGLTLANLAETTASAWLITSLVRGPIRFTRVREILALAAVAVVVNAATALLAAATARWAAGLQFWSYFWTWWVADGLGLLLVTPVIVIWLCSPRGWTGLPRARQAEALAVVGFGCAIAGFEFGWQEADPVIELATEWLYVFVIWSALRCGPRCTATLLLLFATIVIACTSAGLGAFPLGGGTGALRLVAAQIFLGVMGLSGLLLAIAIAQHREDRTLLRALIESTTDAIFVKDRSGRYLLANGAAGKFVGRSVPDILGRDDTFLFSPEDAANVMREDQVTLGATAPRTYEEEVVGGAGERLVFSATKGPLRDATGETIGLFGIARDITARDRAEAARRELEDKFAKVFKDAPVLIAIAGTSDGVFIEVNEETLRVSGRSREEVIGHTASELGWITTADRARIAAEVTACGRVSNVELAVHSKDGKVRRVLVIFEAIEISRRPCILSVGVDITERKLTEQALRESEERYQRITAAITDYIYSVRVVDGRAVETVHGAGCEAVTGYPSSAFNADSLLWLQLVTPEDTPAVLERARLLRAGADPAPLEHRIVHRDGSVRWVRNTFVCHRDEAGRLESYDGLVQDITSLKHAELALAENQARLHRAEQVAGFGHLEIDMGTLEVSLSPGAQKILRLAKPRLTLAELRETCRPSTQAKLDAALRGLVAFGGPTDIEFHLLPPPSGQEVVIRVLAEYDAGRRMVFGVVHDMTDRHHLMTSLQASAASLKKAYEVARLGTYRYEIATGRWEASPLLDAIFGIDDRYPHNVAGWTGLVVDAQRDELADHFVHRVVDCRQRFDREYQVLRPADGELRWVHGMGEIEWNDGEAVALIGTIQDITERRRAEEALRLSEERFRTILQNVESVAVQAYAPDGTTLYWNRASELLYGYSAAEAVGRSLLELIIPPAMQAGVRAAIQEMAVSGRAIPAGELSLRRKDGSRVDVFSSHAIVQLPGRPQELFCVDIDLTERNRAQALLRLQGDALDAAANAIFITNRDGVIEWANPAFTTYTGYTVAEAIGQKPGRLLRSGREKPEYFKTMWNTILAGKVWHGEITNRRKEGSLYTVDVTITPIRDERGDIVQFIAVNQEITEQKKLEAQFRQAQKMEAIGQLAGGVAHDFNNILAAVMMHLGLLQTEESLEPNVRSSLRELTREIQRGAVLTRQLLAFSRQQAMEPQSLDLHGVVSGLLKMLRRLLGENITIDLSGETDAPCIVADTGMIEQVVINLCINARDAMPRGGHLTLRTATVVLSAADIPDSSGALPGRFLRLSVIDTGEGMSEETLQHIFEPFFTTKAVGKGTGLGLATVYGIVRQHRGWVSVESTLGSGSSFHVHLPVSATAAPILREEKRADPARGRGEVILLVEDEANLRAVVALALQRHNYRVLVAANGPDALDQWRRNGGRVDLLLTDLILPGGASGHDLIQRLRAERPRLKTLVTTGYSKDLAPDQFPLLADIVMLRKPFEPGQLLAAVRQCLDQA